MKKELGIARCGLACCLCIENTKCKGCKKEGFTELEWCSDAKWCEVLKCVKSKNLEACYMCDKTNCDEGLFKEKIKPLAFNEFVRRYGLDELLRCLERNEKNGVVYHREGINGDYDNFDSIEDIINFIKNGK